jgi:outer membrane lipoprotein-sorting protein
MTFSKRALLLSALIAPSIVAATVTTTAMQATADEVVEKHLAAIGGREALGKLTSQKATGTMIIGTPGGDLTGPVEVLSKAPNRTRVSISLDLTPMGMSDRMVIDQKFDGTSGWMMNSLQGDQEITGNQLENMKSNVFPTPLLGYKTAGAKVEMQPREDVNGKSAFVVVYTPKSGSAVRMYFDPESFMLLRTRMTVNTPEMGDLDQMRELSDYRTVGGIKTPFMMVNTNAAQTVTMKLEKVEWNVAIDDAVFSAKAPVAR